MENNNTLLCARCHFKTSKWRCPKDHFEVCNLCFETMGCTPNCFYCRTKMIPIVNPN